MMNPNQVPSGADGPDSGSMSNMDALCHPNSMSPILICRQLLRFATSKSSSTSIDSGIESVLEMFRDGHMPESLPKEILATFQSSEMESILKSHVETDVAVILSFLRHIFSKDKQGYAILAIELFGNIWKYSPFFQMKILESAVRQGDYVQIMSSCPNLPVTRRVAGLDQLKSPPDENDPLIRPWVFQSLYDLLVHLSEEQVTHASLEDLFFVAFNKCPDLLIIGLMECEKQSRMKDIVLKKTFTRYLFPQTTHVNVPQVFAKVWPGDPAPGVSTHFQRLLLTALVELYSFALPEDKPAKLARVLDLAQDLKALNLLLGTNSSMFALDLACLASRREYLKLDKWIKDQVVSSNPAQVQAFVEACLEFVKKRCSLFPMDTNTPVTFPAETFGVILLTLRSSFTEPKTILEQEIHHLYNQYVQRLSTFQSNMPFINRLMSDQTNNDSLSSFKTTVRPIDQPSFESYTDFHHYNVEYSKDVEDESDFFFQKIYNQDQPDSLTVDQMLETLKKFQESSNLKERQIYLCIIRNLFKEFPYLEQYPDKELLITGEMFGGIVLYDFVKANVFVSALKTVLDSLKNPHLKYFMFGQAALNKFKTRLKEFPQYCLHLSSMVTTRELSPLILEYIQYGKESQSPPNQVSISSRKTSSQVTVATTNAAAANEDFGENKPAPEILIPSSSFQDKISFIINNLTKITLAKKIDDFKELVAKEKSNYWPWVAQYFVSKRVGLENNYHDIYSKFLTQLQVKEFSKLVLAETYRSIRNILRAHKESDSFTDRTLLKNLGQFLGLITLQKNQPILAIELDPKCLLIEAYHKGDIQILYVIPFVTKILSVITKDCVFALPNPWTMQIIFVLTELHSQPDLKLNMKFEVEVLFKALEIGLEDYKPPVPMLKNAEILSKIESQLGSIPQARPTQEGFLSSRNSVQPGAVPQLAHSTMPPYSVQNSQIGQKYSDIDSSIMGSIGSGLVFHKNNPIFQTTPGIEAYVKTVFEKSVTEWAQHIADRVITVPLGTIETLTKRSFHSIQEPNPQFIRISGECFVKSLVGGYALVHTKDQIMTRIIGLLLQLFQKHCKNIPKEVIDYTANQLVNDNIDASVYYIEKFCVERALEEWNKRWAAEYANFDFESIKNKPRVVTQKQMQFFEEMGKNSSGYHASSATVAPISNPIIDSGNRLKATINEDAQGQQFHPQLTQENPDTMRLVQMFDKAVVNLTELMKDFERGRFPTESLQNIIEYLRMLKQNLRDQKISTNTVKVILLACRHFTSNLPESHPHFEIHPLNRARELCIVLLRTFVEARILPGNVLISNVTRFFTENCIVKEISYPDHLFEYFYKHNLINLSLIDSDFATLLDSNFDQRTLLGVLSFLKHYLNEPSFDISMREFPLTYSCLKDIVGQIRETSPNHMYIKEILSILTSFQRYDIRPQGAVVQSQEMQVSSAEMIEKATFCIREWMTRFSVTKQTSLQDFNETVKTLSAAGFLKTEDSVTNFFRIFMEFVVEKAYHLFKAAAKQAKVQMIEVHMKMFEFIDPFSALAIIFIKETGKNGNLEQKLNLFNRILLVVGQTALREESTREIDFNPWAYYRVILYLFSEMYVPVNLSMPPVMDAEAHHLMENIAAFVTEKFAHLMRIISPNNLSSFAFAWIDIISHKSVMSKFLGTSGRLNMKTWPLYFSILIELFNFLRPYWNVWGVQGDEIARQLYAAQLKIFNLIRLEYPDFLCEFGFQLIQHVPFVSYLMQTRNIILSAVPSSMSRIDLASQIENANMQELNEMAQNQRNPSLITHFHHTRMKAVIENCLSNNSDMKSVVAELIVSFQARSEKGNQLLNNSQLIFGLLLCIGQHAVQNMKLFTIKTVRDSPYFEFFVELLSQIDSQVRYVFFAWMVDHLRYPCKDTLFYASLIQALYPHSDEIGEQIVRSVIERELAYQPHPWGLQLVISELHKNFNILNEDYIRMIPNLDKNLPLVNLKESQKNSAPSPAPGFNPVIGNERE